MFCFHSSRPLITASDRDGGKSEYELASEFYQILNHKAADGSAYITVSSTAPLSAIHPSLHACRIAWDQYRLNGSMKREKTACA